MDKDIELWNKILKMTLQIPFVKVDRTKFLEKELSVYLPQDEVLKAISESPLKVLTKSHLEKIARGCIKYHLTLVTGASALAGLPGGWASAGTIPADIAQFYAHIFALTQKLLYLYGWPDMQNENGEIDDETASILTLFVGVMMGSQLASEAAKNLTKALAVEVAKRLPRVHLTKYMIYNISKQLAKWIGIKLTKQGFSRGVSKVIPLIGAPISAGLTYYTFKPMADKLHKHLESTATFMK